MFRKQSKVEDGRVKAHQTTEQATEKVHELIDKVAERAEVGGEKAADLKVVAAAKAAEVGEQAKAQAADARDRAEKARAQAAKDARKGGKRLKKNARKQAKKGGNELADLKSTVVDDVLPKVVETAVGLAGAGALAGKAVADEAKVRGPEAFHALKDDHDTKGALAALKGETPKKKGRKRKLLLLAIVAGAVAAFLAKKSQGPKKDPWAMPAGDPYKAPESGRESTVPVAGTAAAGAAAPLGDAVTGAPVADEAPADDAAASTGETRPLTDDEVDELGTDAPIGEVADVPTDGTDAWSSARDWADEGVPATGGGDVRELSTEHLGSDQPDDGGVEETKGDNPNA